MGGTIVDGEVLPGGAPDVRSMLFHMSRSASSIPGTPAAARHGQPRLRGRGPVRAGWAQLLADQRPARARRLPLGLLRRPGRGRGRGDARDRARGHRRVRGAGPDKQPAGARRTVAHRELAQLAVARAEARGRAARAFLLDAVRAVGAASAAGDASMEASGTAAGTAAGNASMEASGAAAGEPSGNASMHAPGNALVEQRALLRLAACHAVTEAAAAVDLVYEAGGGSSIYATSPLQRCFRDVHTATQHIMVSPTAATLAGRILLGIESDISTL
jgi:hypothetical protein